MVKQWNFILSQWAHCFEILCIVLQNPSNRTADGPSPLAPVIPIPTLVPNGISNSNFLGSLNSPEVFFSGLLAVLFFLVNFFLWDNLDCLDVAHSLHEPWIPCTSFAERLITELCFMFWKTDSNQCLKT